MLSIGILSHYAPRTLQNTLSTYKKAGLFELTDDLFVVLQMSNRQAAEKEVCDSFGIRSICLPDNGKMAWGFKAIYENARHEHMLFLENDFVINESSAETESFIKNALYFINSCGADVVRGRSRKNGGVPNHAYQNLREIPVTNFVNNTHLSECIYWVDHPEQIYPSRISKIDPKEGSDSWYTTASRYCNYTNNPYVCTKDFFKKAVLPYIEFGKTLETELTAAWASNEYKCVFGPGLFTHDRSYDGHN